MTLAILCRQAILFIIRVEIQECYSFVRGFDPVRNVTVSVLCSTGHHWAGFGKGLLIAGRNPAEGCQGFSLMIGHVVPGAASGACGGRTIRPSEWANIFIMDESCFAWASATSRPFSSVLKRARR